MDQLRVFISSVQREFAEERAALKDYLAGDPLLRRFFDCFMFEEVPAADRRADELYLDEVERCDLYLGLFGYDYGHEDPEGIAPTQREFDHATSLQKTRLIFVKGASDAPRHPKMQWLIQRAGAQLIRRRIASTAELIAGLYAALVQYLEDHQLIRNGPWKGPCAFCLCLRAPGNGRNSRTALPSNMKIISGTPTSSRRSRPDWWK